MHQSDDGNLVGLREGGEGGQAEECGDQRLGSELVSCYHQVRGPASQELPDVLDRHAQARLERLGVMPPQCGVIHHVGQPGQSMARRQRLGRENVQARPGDRPAASASMSAGSVDNSAARCVDEDGVGFMRANWRGR